MPDDPAEVSQVGEPTAADGSPGELALRAANGRVDDALTTSRELLNAGFASAAFVWAVRGVEIFMKEFLLLPHFLPSSDGQWSRALRRASKLFGASNWDKAWAVILREFGPLEPIVTEAGGEDDQRKKDILLRRGAVVPGPIETMLVEGCDALELWKNEIVPKRGAIVHGRDEASVHEAATALAYAEQLVLQIKLRLIVAGKHPLHSSFLGELERFGEMVERGERGERA